MKIVNVSAEPLQACASFAYRGFTISASRIFRTLDVCILDASGEPLRDESGDARSFVNVEAAIRFIDGAHLAKLEAALLDCTTLEGARCFRSPTLAGFVRRLQAINSTAVGALKRDGETVYATIARVKK